jgi:hypothetical protein
MKYYLIATYGWNRNDEVPLEVRFAERQRSCGCAGTF